MTELPRNKLGVSKRRPARLIAPTAPNSDPPPSLEGRTPPLNPGHKGAATTNGEETAAPDAVKSTQSPSLDAWQLGAEYLVGSVVVDGAICDYAGVAIGSIALTDRGLLESIPSHPTYVTSARQATLEPVPNQSKVHLVDWHAPIEDQGNVVRLEVAKSDFWTSVATKSVLARLQSDIEEGVLDLPSLPRRLDVHLVVICGADNKLLLTLRGSHVATEPDTWMITVGESMDWARDSTHGIPQPEETARHCLEERDELNLGDTWAQTADLRLIALATEWTEMLVNLIVVARVPELDFDEAKKRFRRGENVRIDAVDFTPAACSPLIQSGRFRGAHPAAREAVVSDISRAALLAALRHDMGDPDWTPGLSD